MSEDPNPNTNQAEEELEQAIEQADGAGVDPEDGDDDSDELGL
jgi:hypothetical protein